MVAELPSIIVGAIWTVMVAVLAVIGSVFLLRYKKRYIIKGRGPLWTLLLLNALLCLFGLQQMMILIFEYDLKCFGPELTNNIIINFLCLLYAWRLWVLMFQFKIATKLDEYQKSRQAKTKALAAANAANRATPSIIDGGDDQKNKEDAQKEVKLTIDTNLPSNMTPAQTPIAHQHTIMSDSLTEGKGAWFIRNRHLMKFTAWPIAVWVAVIVINIVVPIIFELVTPCDPYGSSNPVPRYNVACLVFWFAVVVLLGFKTANPGQDAFGIKRELLVELFVVVPLIILWYIVVTGWPTTFLPQLTISAAVTLWLWICSFAHPLWRARINDAQLDFKGIANMRSLDDLIEVDIGYSSLLEYLKTEFSQENLLFYSQVKKFKDTFGQSDYTAFSLRERCLKQAQEIINTFVLEDAPMQVNISSECHYNLLRQWHQELTHEEHLPLGAKINMVPNDKNSPQLQVNSMHTITDSIQTSPVDGDGDGDDDDDIKGNGGGGGDNESHDSRDDSRDDVSVSNDFKKPEISAGHHSQGGVEMQNTTPTTATPTTTTPTTTTPTTQASGKQQTHHTHGHHHHSSHDKDKRGSDSSPQHQHSPAHVKLATTGTNSQLDSTNNNNNHINRAGGVTFETTAAVLNTVSSAGIAPAQGSSPPHPHRLTPAVKKKEKEEKRKLRKKQLKEKKAKMEQTALTTLTVAHVFDEAAKEIHKLMTRDSLPRFLRSDQFTRFVQDFHARTQAASQQAMSVFHDKKSQRTSKAEAKGKKSGSRHELELPVTPRPGGGSHSSSASFGRSSIQISANSSTTTTSQGVVPRASASSTPLFASTSPSPATVDGVNGLTALTPADMQRQPSEPLQQQNQNQSHSASTSNLHTIASSSSDLGKVTSTSSSTASSAVSTPTTTDSPTLTYSQLPSAPHTPEPPATIHETNHEPVEQVMHLDVQLEGIRTRVQIKTLEPNNLSLVGTPPVVNNQRQPLLALFNSGSSSDTNS